MYREIGARRIPSTALACPSRRHYSFRASLVTRPTFCARYFQRRWQKATRYASPVTATEISSSRWWIKQENNFVGQVLPSRFPRSIGNKHSLLFTIHPARCVATTGAGNRIDICYLATRISILLPISLFRDTSCARRNASMAWYLVTIFAFWTMGTTIVGILKRITPYFGGPFGQYTVT